MAVVLTTGQLAQTFDRLRSCGGGRRECQALWLGRRGGPLRVTRVVHPIHSASAVGFSVDQSWLGELWTELAQTGEAILVQVHTHPGAAYHSATDDAYPILSVPGFLSLVIPRFALGEVGWKGAFLARLGEDGVWSAASIEDHLEIVP